MAISRGIVNGVSYTFSKNAVAQVIRVRDIGEETLPRIREENGQVGVSEVNVFGSQEHGEYRKYQTCVVDAQHGGQTFSLKLIFENIDQNHFEYQAFEGLLDQKFKFLELPSDAEDNSRMAYAGRLRLLKGSTPQAWGEPLNPIYTFMT